MNIWCYFNNGFLGLDLSNFVLTFSSKLAKGRTNTFPTNYIFIIQPLQSWVEYSSSQSRRNCSRDRVVRKRHEVQKSQVPRSSSSHCARFACRRIRESSFPLFATQVSTGKCYFSCHTYPDLASRTSASTPRLNTNQGNQYVKFIHNLTQKSYK